MTAAERISAGGRVPAIEVADTGGKALRLAPPKGRPLLLFWFAPRSRPAEAAAPWVRELHEEYGRKGVAVVGLAVPMEPDPAAAAEKFRKRHRWRFPVAVDEGALLVRRFGAEAGVPKVAIVGPDGLLAYVRAGVDPDEVEATLDRLLLKGETR